MLRDYPDLVAKALNLEEMAKDSFKSIKGLGRSFSWAEVMEEIEGAVEMGATWEEAGIAVCDCRKRCGPLKRGRRDIAKGMEAK